MTVPRTIFLALALACAGSTVALAGPDRATLLKARRARAQQSLHKLQQGRQLDLQWPAHRSRHAVIRGLAHRVSGATVEQRARTFLGRYPALFAAAHSTLKLVHSRGTHQVRVVRFQQVHRGVPVEGAELNVVQDRAGRVTAVTSEVEPLDLASVTPRIRADAAINAVLRGATGGKVSRAARQLVQGLRPRLVIIGGGAPRLVYKVMLPLSLNPHGRWYLVDAGTGKVVGWRPGAIIERRPHAHQEVPR